MHAETSQNEVGVAVVGDIHRASPVIDTLAGLDDLDAVSTFNRTPINISSASVQDTGRPASDPAGRVSAPWSGLTEDSTVPYPVHGTTLTTVPVETTLSHFDTIDPSVAPYSAPNLNAVDVT